MLITDFLVTREDEEITLSIELYYYRAYRGHRDKYGCPEEPDEPAHFEIESVQDEQGRDFDLTESEEEAVYEKANNLQQDEQNDPNL